MIAKLVKAIVFLVCVYIATMSYLKYQEITRMQFEQIFDMKVLSLVPNKEWNDSQFDIEKQQSVALKYRVNAESQSIDIESTQMRVERIQFSDLSIQIQDARSISSIDLVTRGSNVRLLKINSKYFTMIYNPTNKLVVYEKIHLEPCDDVYYVDQEGKLWVIGYPHYNIVLLRVYSGQAKALLYSNRYQVKQKVQLIKRIQQTNDQLAIKFLTFSRNYLVFEINKKSCSLQSIQPILTHSISQTAISRALRAPSITLAAHVLQQQSYSQIESLTHHLSFGYLGKASNGSASDLEPNQEDYGFDVLDDGRNIVVEYNHTHNYSTVVGFDAVMLPFRTPVFVSNRDIGLLLPFDQVLNKSRNSEQLPSVDFKLYGIRSKSLEVLKAKTGLYRLLPDASVHFMAFDERFLNFYPTENVKEDEYYAVRTERGAVVLKQSKIKGILDEPAVPNPKAVQLKFGYSKQQVYQELTTNAAEVGPGVYEAHVIHKGMLVKTYKNRVELVTILNGKPVTTHYLNKKEGYEYSTSFVENNEFWVFEHRDTSGPLITKYELFLNASSPKTTLQIKRTYDLSLPVGSRITRIQKCVDFFYYLTYVTVEGRLGVTRVHHVLLSNRQPKVDESYAGAFEKAMVIKQIQRNKKFNISNDEEEVITAEFELGHQIIQHGKQLPLKHQYKILPIRVFVHENQYYIVNLRKLMTNAFNKQIKQAKIDVRLKAMIVSVVLISLSTIMIFLQFKNKSVNPAKQEASPIVKKESPALNKASPKKKNKKQ